MEKFENSLDEDWDIKISRRAKAHINANASSIVELGGSPQTHSAVKLLSSNTSCLENVSENVMRLNFIESKRHSTLMFPETFVMDRL
jgi:hypothetical protein